METKSSGVVYILQSTSGRYYIGSTENFKRRLERHNAGMVYSTKRLGIPLIPIVTRHFPSMKEARKIEVMLKRWKNPSKAIHFLKDPS